ncbi:MAG: NAD-dependent epimerase/dehydratase family protein [Armatimonadetes bacterium]|nr:NAD-dependent epimerase/dehydratase family protein [Armatimonadota bacterium]
MTGGAGFIGTTLAGLLAPDNEITLFDNLHRDAFSGSPLARHPRVRLIQGNVLDLPALREAMKGAQIVIHLAAIAGVDEVLKSPVRTMEVNVIGTYNVLEAASTLDNLEVFLDFSTSEVFGTHAYKVDELHQTAQGHVGEARWTYAVSKLVGEHLSHAYWHEKGIPTVSVRPFNVYGPGQVGVGAIQQFMLRVVRGEDLVVKGDGSQIRAWCHVDDMVAGTLLCLEKREAVGQVFNIGNPRSTVTIHDLALRIIQISGAPLKIVYEPLDYVDIEIRIPNIDKARTLLGFQPKVDLDEGLRRTYEWFKARHGS